MLSLSKSMKQCSTTGFIIQIETATGMYQKGQYSKAFTKSGRTLKSSQMAVATNCKQFYEQSYSTYSKNTNQLK